MSSYGTGGKIHFIPNNDDLEKNTMEGGYPFSVPSVYLEGVFEEYYPQTGFSWSDASVVVKTEKTVIKYTEHDYSELYAEDENGNKIWVDGRNASYEDCWDGHYLGDTRLGHSFSTTVYNLDTLTKRVTEYTPNEKEEPMSEYEIGEYANLSNPANTNNEDNLISKIKNDHKKYLELPDNLKNDIEFNKKLITNSYSFNFLEYVPSSVKDKEDFVLLALSKDGNNLSFLSEKVKDDYKIVLAAVSNNAFSLEFASERLKDDDTIVKSAIAKSGCAIQFASSRLKKKDEFIRIALLDDYRAFGFLPDDIRNNREYALFAIKYNNSLYNFMNSLPDCLKSDKELVIGALKHGEHYSCLVESMKNDRDVAIIAIEQDEGSYTWMSMPEFLRNTEELARAAILKDPSCISQITDSNLRDKLIKEDPYLAFFLREDNDAKSDYPF